MENILFKNIKIQNADYLLLQEVKDLKTK